MPRRASHDHPKLNSEVPSTMLYKSQRNTHTDTDQQSSIANQSRIWRFAGAGRIAFRHSMVLENLSVVSSPKREQHEHGDKDSLKSMLPISCRHSTERLWWWRDRDDQVDKGRKKGDCKYLKAIEYKESSYLINDGNTHLHIPFVLVNCWLMKKKTSNRKAASYIHSPECSLRLRNVVEIACWESKEKVLGEHENVRCDQ